MATGRTRDEQAVVEGFASWLRGPGRRPEARVVELARPGTGHSNETFLVTLDTEGRVERLVLRLPPLVPLVPDYDLGREAAVLEALGAHALPVPRPVAFEREERFLAGPFLVLPMVEGHVVGEAPVLDPWLADAPQDAQARVERGFLEVMARAHRVDVGASGLGAVLRRWAPADELAWWSGYLDWAFGGSPLPTLTTALAHLADTAPEPASRPGLLWGDARLGNVIYDDAYDVRAALDWELATIGPAEADLAWYLALGDLLHSFVDRRLPGFLAREELVATYERRLGRPVEHLRWHETFALVRSAAINARIARMTGSRRRGTEDDPVLAHLRSRWDPVVEGIEGAGTVRGEA